MTQRITAWVISAAVVFGVAQVFAHDEYRIIGTIVGRQNTTLTLKSREGKTMAVKLGGETLVYRDNKKVDAAELKAGRYVVVDALGDSVTDLLAVEVRLIAALPK